MLPVRLCTPTVTTVTGLRAARRAMAAPYATHRATFPACRPVPAGMSAPTGPIGRGPPATRRTTDDRQGEASQLRPFFFIRLRIQDGT